MIPIFIPYVNREDLLQKAVESIPLNHKMWQFEVINNSGATLPEDLWADDCNPPVPLTFAQSQNWMLKLAEEWNGYDDPAPYYFFMHNDAEAGEGTILRLYAMAEAFTIQKRKWGAIFTAYDALAAFNTEAMRAVGGWDTNLPQYFSDNDMYRRLRLAGYEIVESNLPVKHDASQTIRSDAFRNYVNGITFPIYKNYYVAKWGGEPGRETFDVPFGGRFGEVKA